MKPPASLIIGLTLMAVGCLLSSGCQATPSGPVLKARLDAPVWPPAPDKPRIRFLGQLIGEESLGRAKSGLEVLRDALAGPQAMAKFMRPSAIAISGETVFVADPGARVIHRLQLDSREYAAIVGVAGQPLGEPVALQIVGQKLYAVDRRNACLEVFDLAGNHQQTIKNAQLSAPVAIAFDAERELLWISDVNSHQLWALTNTGQLAPVFGQRGEAPGMFNYPTGLAWHSTSGLAVVDAMNFRVQLINASGAVRAIIGKAGDAAGNFARPRDVAFDAAGRLYVVDNQFENVQVFDADGQLLMAFGRGGSDDPGRFSVPSGITIDARNRIWVADSYHQRVQVFEILGEAS